MSGMVPSISASGLFIAFLPALLVIGIMYRWRAGAGTAVYATTRMLVQLLLIGYVLIYIFESDRWPLIVAVLLLMIAVASWISTRHLHTRDLQSYLRALIAIGLPSLLILALVTRVVINVEPWFLPRFVVPLAGMIIAGGMNAVGLAAERFQAETSRGVGYKESRRTALQASLIPIINSLLAVGLVALPGMMTGQILSGVSPLIAAKYQIVVMTMLFGVAGLSSVIYLGLPINKKGPRAGP
jgi:putative ABC transport system permease protein